MWQDEWNQNHESLQADTCTSVWLSQVTFICDTSPPWFSPLCLGWTPSFSSHPPPFYLSIHPSIPTSSWPASRSDFLPDSELTVPGCRWVKWWEMEEEDMRGNDGGILLPMLLHVNVHAAHCAVLAMYANYRQHSTSRGLLKGPSSLTQQFWDSVDYSIGLPSFVWWMVGNKQNTAAVG